jgi:aspartyl protease family protein
MPARRFMSGLLVLLASAPLCTARGQLPTIDRNTRPHDTASATRVPGGHFVFQTEVNGAALPMVFDTGASYVTLRAEDAERIGIRMSALQFTDRVNTANGVTETAPVLLASLKVGNISRTNVPAQVARPGALRVNLLGQSFMKMMAGFSEDGDQLVLRGN